MINSFPFWHRIYIKISKFTLRGELWMMLFHDLEEYRCRFALPYLYIEPTWCLMECEFTNSTRFNGYVEFFRQHTCGRMRQNIRHLWWRDKIKLGKQRLDFMTVLMRVRFANQWKQMETWIAVSKDDSVKTGMETTTMNELYCYNCKMLKTVKILTFKRNFMTLLLKISNAISVLQVYMY